MGKKSVDEFYLIISEDLIDGWLDAPFASVADAEKKLNEYIKDGSVDSGDLVAIVKLVSRGRIEQTGLSFVKEK